MEDHSPPWICACVPLLFGFAILAYFIWVQTILRDVARMRTLVAKMKLLLVRASVAANPSGTTREIAALGEEFLKIVDSRKIETWNTNKKAGVEVEGLKREVNEIVAGLTRLRGGQRTSIGEEIQILAQLRQDGAISESEFRAFSEQFKISGGEKADAIMSTIAELNRQRCRGAMSDGEYREALWGLLDKLDRGTWSNSGTTSSSVPASGGTTASSVPASGGTTPSSVPAKGQLRLWHVVLLFGVFCFLVPFWMLAHIDDSKMKPNSPETVSGNASSYWTADIGNNARLYSSHYISIGFCPSGADYDRWRQCLASNDIAGIKEMQRRLRGIPNGILCKIIQFDFDNANVEVRIMEGELVGASGWIGIQNLVNPEALSDYKEPVPGEKACLHTLREGDPPVDAWPSKADCNRWCLVYLDDNNTAGLKDMESKGELLKIPGGTLCQVEVREKLDGGFPLARVRILEGELSGKRVWVMDMFAFKIGYYHPQLKFQEAQLAASEGQQLSLQGKDAEAVLKYRKAVMLCPDDTHLRADLAVAEATQAFMDRNYDMMLAKDQEALSLDPNWVYAADVAMAYGCKYAVSGDAAFKAKAEEYMAQAQALAGPNNADWRMTYQRLKHRLETRQILSLSVFAAKFPKGYPPPAMTP